MCDAYLCTVHPSMSKKQGRSGQPATLPTFGAVPGSLADRAPHSRSVSVYLAPCSTTGQKEIRVQRLYRELYHFFNFDVPAGGLVFDMNPAATHHAMRRTWR